MVTIENGILLAGLDGSDTLRGTGANDTIYGNDGKNIVYDNVVDNDTMYGGYGNDALYGDFGDDIIYGGSQAVDPFDDADTLFGGFGSDIIYGNGGNDNIFGNARADVIYGGFGSDTIYGNFVSVNDTSPDTIFGNEDSDLIYGSSGKDLIFGGSDVYDPDDAGDTIYGGAGNDLIFGNGGDDALYGGDGDDTLYGGFGVNTLSGGAGQDVFYINGGTRITDRELGEKVFDDPTSAESEKNIFSAGNNQTIIITDFDESDRIEINTTSQNITFQDLVIKNGALPSLSTISVPSENAVIQVFFNNVASAVNLDMKNVIVNGGSAKPSSVNTVSGSSTPAAPANAAPGVINDSNITVNLISENASNGDTVGITASSTDPEGSPLSYSLSDNAGGRFAIDGSTGVITVANAGLLNYEIDASHVVTVVASDGALNTSQNFTINVGDIAEAPIDVTISSDNVDENSAIGTVVGTFDTQDDAGDAHTYSLINNAGGIFRLSGANLEVNGILNHELVGSYNIIVRSDDGNSNIIDKNLTININDVNDAPIYGNQTYNINEDAANGAVVGIATANDEDGDVQSYVIIGGNTSNIFAIGSTTGVIAINDNINLNFEANNQYILEIQSSDGNGGTDNAFITVNITDSNDAPTINSQSFSIDENANINDIVGDISASDEDGDTLTYAITGGNGAGVFAIDANTGRLTVNSGGLDYESVTSHNLTITATDNGTGTLASSAAITINVTDSNDAPTIADQSLNINEDAANGSAIGAVTASDADGDNLFYAIVAGNGDGMFAINAFTGVVTIADNSNLNHETAANRALTIEVTDNGAGTLTDTATLTIAINDVNDAPDIVNQTLNVLDTANDGDVVGTPTATDEDGDNLTYTITSGNSAGIFAINSATGQITVADSAQINSAPPYALTVQVSDDGVGTLSNSAIVNITVNEVNDAPVINNQTYNINENSGNGAAVATISASDPEGHALHYSIISGNADGIFAIDASTGVITIADNTNLNHEYDDSHALQIRVRETSTAELYQDDATVTINVDDINEAPIYNNASFTVAENAANGAIGNVTASEVDDGQTLTYNIISGNSLGIFGINASTGELSIADNTNLNFESLTQHNLVVRATDNGSGTLSDTSTVTVTVTNANDAPVNTAPTNITVNEDQRSAIAGLAVADEDTGTLLSVTLSVAQGVLTLKNNVSGGVNAANISGNGTGSITITNQSATKINATLSAADGLLYQGDAHFFGADTLQMQTSDGTLTDIDNIGITVTSVNDAPTVEESILTQGLKSSETWNYTFSSSLFDDIENDTLTYTAQISSDNDVTYTALPAWITINGATRTFNIASPPGDANEGAYVVKILANDGNGGITDALFNLAVTDDLYGGVAGDDVIVGSSADEVIYGGPGADTLVGRDGVDTIFGAEGNDRIHGDTENTSADNSADLIFGGAGDDSITSDTNGNNQFLANDTVYGESGNDTIRSYKGHDLLDGGSGNDEIYAGNDNDTIYGGSGEDSIRGEGDEDLIYGGAGNDTLEGGSGNDTIYGEADDDLIDASTGDDIIIGGSGDDTLQGQEGADTLTGGDGADTFLYNAPISSESSLYHDIITDFEQGSDIIRLSVFNNIVQGVGNATDRTLEYYQTGTGATAKTIVRSDMINYNFYLELTGHINLTNADFEYFGTVGTSGSENINGSSGLDVILGFNGDDTINGGDGQDLIYGGNGNDSITGHFDKDTLYGDDGDDYIHGGLGNDTIYGGEGNDTIVDASGGGQGELYGGAGNDVFLINSSFDNRDGSTNSGLIKDFAKGEDVIRFAGIPLTGFYFGGADNLNRPHDLNIQYFSDGDFTRLEGNFLFEGGGARRIRVYLDGDYASTGPNQLDVNDIEFTNVVTDNSAGDLDPTANIIRSSTTSIDGVVGTSGNDTIYAGDDNHDPFEHDEVHGGDGDDVIVYKAQYQDGIVNGGRGNDTLFLTSNSSRLVRLGSDDDGSSETIILSGNARMSLSGINFSGGDLIIGGANTDYMFADNGTGSQTFYGRHGHDDIRAGKNFGGDGADYIDGGFGDDTLRAGAGSDTLIGGVGADYLYGDNGNDSFIFKDIHESTIANTDVIWNFNSGDEIHLYGFTGIGSGTYDLTITQYNASQHGQFNKNWTDITASSNQYDLKITVLGHQTFTVGNNLILHNATMGNESAEALTGDAGNNYIIGNRGSDTIFGLDGDDSLFGSGDGGDLIYGGNGADSIDGGDQNDTLWGGTGSDTLIGGEGNDIFTFEATDSTNAAMDIIWDFGLGDNDRIDLSHASFGGISFGDLTITTPEIAGGNYTIVSHAGTGFEVGILGYYETGYNLGAGDFIF